MKEADIANALAQRLAELPSLGVIVWENKDATTPRPYLEFEVVRVDRRELTLSKGAAVSRGYVLVTIVDDVDKFSTSATTKADEVAARFPFGDRIDISGGGKIVVISPPSVLQGFREGPDWRVPVRIDYEASA